MIYSLIKERIFCNDTKLKNGITELVNSIKDSYETLKQMEKAYNTAKESLESESFTDNLLDYPVYTKPRVFRGMEVPEVLVSGDHAKINKYREEQRLQKTKEVRSDLLERED